MDYGPDLTPKLKAKLLREIAAFDKSRTLEEIEKEALSAPAVDSYTDWKEDEEVSAEAEPDSLREDQLINLSKPVLSSQIIAAKREIDELLSFRELQIWRCHMRKGLSLAKTSTLLHITEGTASQYLSRAIRKVKKHFGGRGE